MLINTFSFSYEQFVQYFTPPTSLTPAIKIKLKKKIEKKN